MALHRSRTAADPFDPRGTGSRKRTRESKQGRELHPPSRHHAQATANHSGDSLRLSSPFLHAPFNADLSLLLHGCHVSFPGVQGGRMCSKDERIGSRLCKGSAEGPSQDRGRTR